MVVREALGIGTSIQEEQIRKLRTHLDETEWRGHR